MSENAPRGDRNTENHWVTMPHMLIETDRQIYYFCVNFCVRLKTKDQVAPELLDTIW